MLFNSYCRKIINSVSVFHKIHFFRRMSTEKVDKVELAYKCYDNAYAPSSKAPVIVLHGLLSSKNSWMTMSDGIHKATRRKVICVDARNHGDSEHSSEHTYTHMAQDVINLIQKLKLSKVTLLGHSMGGRTAMVVSLLHPEKVSSLVVVDISPVSISRLLTANFPPVLDFISTIDFKGFASVQEATTFAKNQLLAFGVSQMEVISFLLKNIGIKADKTVGWTCNTEVLKESFPVLTTFPSTSGKLFPGPTLFVGGGQSDFIPEEDLAGIKRYFPRAELKYIPDVGHNIHEQDPATLLSLTTKFLLDYEL